MLYHNLSLTEVKEGYVAAITNVISLLPNKSINVTGCVISQYSGKCYQVAEHYQVNSLSYYSIIMLASVL